MILILLTKTGFVYSVIYFRESQLLIPGANCFSNYSLSCNLFKHICTKREKNPISTSGTGLLGAGQQDGKRTASNRNSGHHNLTLLHLVKRWANKVMLRTTREDVWEKEGSLWCKGARYPKLLLFSLPQRNPPKHHTFWYRSLHRTRLDVSKIKAPGIGCLFGVSSLS